MRGKTKIVLDADVVIHFIKGGWFSLLPDILPDYQYIILDAVYGELCKRRETKTVIDNSVNLLKRISVEKFNPIGESLRQYALLRQKYGSGESACMQYCRDNNDVLGSSNLRDIHEYCQQNGITYLTTLDFLYYAYVHKKMTNAEIIKFITDVNARGSKLPEVDITTYTCYSVV